MVAKKPVSNKEKVQQAIFNGQFVTKENMREAISRDIETSYILVWEVLQSKECLDAITEVFYARYLKVLSDQKAEAEKVEPSIPYSDDQSK